jgi:hypothetical protein
VLGCEYCECLGLEFQLISLYLYSVSILSVLLDVRSLKSIQRLRSVGLRAGNFKVAAAQNVARRIQPPLGSTITILRPQCYFTLVTEGPTHLVLAHTCDINLGPSSFGLEDAIIGA